MGDRGYPMGVLPFAQVDTTRVVPAQHRGYNEFPWEVDFDDGGYQFQGIPHLDDKEDLTEEYPLDWPRWSRDMTEAHPGYLRNNYYEVDYVTEMWWHNYTWPDYYVNDRNQQVVYSANSGQLSKHG